jgi:hypothetical protein
MATMLTICLTRSARTSSHVRAVEQGVAKQNAMYHMANLEKLKQLSGVGARSVQ